MASTTNLSIVINAKDQASRIMGGLQQQVNGFGATILKNNKAIGLGMTAMGASIVAGGGMATKSFVEFESGMREVNTMMGLGQEEFDAFSKQVRGMSSELGVDAVRSTKALYQAISAGVPKKNVLGFMEIATKAAIAGVTDAETAVDGLSTVMNAFKMPMEDAQRVADVMFTTVKGGKTTFEELSASMSTAAPLAAAMGVNFEEVMAATASLTKQGVPTSQAMTQIRAAMVALTKPTEGMQRILEEMGFATGEAALESMGFNNVMQAMTEVADSTGYDLAKAVGSVEALGAVLALTGENREAAVADLKAMESATEGAGAATDAFTEINKSAARRMESMNAKIQDVKMAIGEQLLPIVTALVEKISKVVSAIVNWMKEHPALAKVIVIAVGVIGTLMAVLGPLVLLLPILTAALPMLGAAFSLMLGPVGLIIVAITALIAIGVAVWKNWDTIKEKAKVIWGAITDFFKSTWETIKNVFKEHWDKILAVLFPAVGLPILIQRNWGKIVDFVKGIWDKVVGFFKAGVGKAIESLNWLIDKFRDFSWHFSGLKIAGLQIIPEFTFAPFKGIPRIPVPSFRGGGMVNAPIGQPVPAILHGGEQVIPAGRQAGGVTVVLSNPVFLGDESSARQLTDLIGVELQRKYRLGWSPT